MRLNKIFINHFKNIDKATISMDGKNVTVRGENGTGKTTLADAYTWCVSGKGFDGKSIDTQIKKRDKDGGTPNDGGIEHTVELEFQSDTGKTVSLRREFKEKWEKHRGQAESEFKGHTTTYAVDGVPLAKKDYDGKIGELMKGDAFPLLSMPLQFCTNIKWQERRKILLEICGDKSDEDIIASDEKLAPLKTLLKDKTVEEFRKIVQSKLKKVNEETGGIPARIDELVNMKPTSPENKNIVEQELRSIEQQREELRQQLAKIENGGEVAEKQKQLVNVEAQIERIKSAVDLRQQREDHEKKQAEEEVMRLTKDVQRAQAEIERYKACIDTAYNLAENLRDEWKIKHNEIFTAEVSENCPCCGQKLPTDKLETAKNEAVEQFNIKKAEALKAINEKGRRIIEQKERDEAVINEKEATINEKSQRINELVEQIAAINKSDCINIENDNNYTVLKAKADKLKTEIETLKNEENSELKEKIQSEIGELGAKIDAYNDELATIKQSENIERRIEELKLREKELAATYSQLKKQLFLTEEFMRAKVRVTETNINSHFKYVRWKMFKERINGALEECCEPLIDGVPFSEGLNKGNKMKAALDIVNALSGYYGITLPIFIDDCESYTSLPAVNAQVIKLIAEKGQKSLKFEIE